VGKHRERTQAYTVERLRSDAKGCLVRLAGIDDRDIVKGLTNQLWFEPRASFTELADDEIYFADLIGLLVKTVDGQVIGPVKDVVEIGPSDILVIDRDGREVMVPNVESMVQSMNLDVGEIIITPPAGLIDDLE
jgi:16S rRNA processing protein RimM